MARKPGKRPWYADGIRFECQSSGKCCLAHGRYNRVYIDDEELPDILGHLGLTQARFERRYCWFEDGFRLLRFTDGHCPFLDDRKCQIYRARPIQCSTWPFWKHNMRKRVWERDVRPFCPGVGRGQLHTREEIDEIAARMDEE